MDQGWCRVMFTCAHSNLHDKARRVVVVGVGDGRGIVSVFGEHADYGIINELLINVRWLIRELVMLWSQAG